MQAEVYAFRRGRTAEDIFKAYPSIGSLANVYGVMTYILEHPKEIETYLQDEARALESFQATHPLPAEMLEPFERARPVAWSDSDSFVPISLSGIPCD